MKKLSLFLLILSLFIACQDTTSRNLSVTSSSIYGGAAVPDADWVSTVAISLTGEVFCSGVLISKNKILTAAHCVKAYSERQLKNYGAVNFGSGKNKIWLSSIGIVKAEANQDYNDTVTYNQGDFGLITLAKDAPDFAKPVSAITEAELAALDKSNLPITLVGYGQRENGDSGEKFQTQTVVTDFFKLEFSGGTGDGHGACHGDSGGPAYVQLAGGEWRVLGVTSRGDQQGTKCSTKDFIYSRADSAIDLFNKSTIYQSALDFYLSNKDALKAAQLAQACSGQAFCDRLMLKMSELGNDWENALRLISPVVEAKPTINLINEKIMILQKLGRADSEIQIEQDKVDALRLVERANSNVSDGHYTIARDLINQAVLKSPDFPILYMMRVRINLSIMQKNRSTNPQEANEMLDDLNKYIQARPSDEIGYYYRSAIYNYYFFYKWDLAKKDLEMIKQLAK